MTATAARTTAIRVLARDESPALLAALARLIADAYPILNATTADALAALAASFTEQADHPGTAWAIAEDGGVLVGAMRLYDYRMRVRSRDAFCGGVGSVAVARDRKREGIARALIRWYLDHFRARGAAFAALHAFRPDFYRALGFGYGTPVHRFRFAPSALRVAGARGTARFLDAADCDALHACYERVRGTTNGLIAKHRTATLRGLNDPALRYVGIDRDGELRAFMQTSVHPGGADVRNRDELVVRDLAYEDETALAALLAHLSAQRDQFARIVVESQDAAFYLAAADPRDGSDRAVAPPAAHRVAQTGLGIMYRILDLDAALAHLPATAAPLTLALAVDDDLTPATAAPRTLRFGPHGASVAAGEPSPDATLAIGIHDLASIVTGSLRVRDLVAHRLATIEPRALLDRVDAAFFAPQPPYCTTRF